jgi:hypothetical protein
MRWKKLSQARVKEEGVTGKTDWGRMGMAKGDPGNRATFPIRKAAR